MLDNKSKIFQCDISSGRRLSVGQICARKRARGLNLACSILKCLTCTFRRLDQKLAVRSEFFRLDSSFDLSGLFRSTFAVCPVGTFCRQHECSRVRLGFHSVHQVVRLTVNTRSVCAAETVR